MASVAKESEGDFPGLPRPGMQPRGHHGHDAETALLDPAFPAGAQETVFAEAAERGLEAFGIWSGGEVTTAIASSTGVRAVDAVTDAYLKVILRDPAVAAASPPDPRPGRRSWTPCGWPTGRRPA